MQLFSRPDCHLCDDALELLESLGLADQVSVINIEPDLQLIRRYGDKIPVLRWDNGNELCWPFTSTQIEQQLAAE